MDHQGIPMTYNLTVGDLAKQLAKITALSETYHARQLRAQIREDALTSPVRGGSGVTAPKLFDESGVARALILHVLAMTGLEMPLLRQAGRACEVVNPAARKAGIVEPSDGVALAISRLKADPKAKMYLQLSVSEWPGDEGEMSLGGWISDSAEPFDSPVSPSLICISLPLHTILKPLVA